MTTISLTHRVTRPTILWRFAIAAAAAAMTELAILRVFTRTAIHIPGAGDAAPGLSAVSELGRFSYYLASVLLAVTLVLVACRLVANSSVGDMVALIGIAALTAVAFGVRAGIVAEGATDVGVIGALIAVGVAATVHLEARARVPVALFVAGFTLTGLDALGGDPGGRSAIRIGAETLVLVAAASLPLAMPGRPDRRSLIVGATVGVLVIGAFAANGTTPRILLLWNFGVPGAFPGVVYGVAIGLLVTALVWGWRCGERERTIALVLVACGGIGLHSTYQSALAVVGLALLVIASHYDPERMPCPGIATREGHAT